MDLGISVLSLPRILLAIRYEKREASSNSNVFSALVIFYKEFLLQVFSTSMNNFYTGAFVQTGPAPGDSCGYFPSFRVRLESASPNYTSCIFFCDACSRTLA